MKNKLLQPLIMASKYMLLGVLTQTLLTGLLLASEVEAQAKSVREVYIVLKVNKSSVEEIMQLIESETDYNFSYYQGEIDLGKQVSLNGQRMSIYDLLVDVSAQTGLSFRQINNVINVKNKGQGKNTGEVEIVKIALTVIGKVSDANGESLPGVNVLVKGSTIGTATEVDGNYSLNVPNEDDTLIFSFIGYATQEVAVNGRTTIDVSLEEDMQSLEEVVVVGYGTKKKASLTTSVASISGESLVEQSTSGDLRKTLQGMAPGLTILDNGGQPGDNKIQMQIRGISSINGSEPLVLVDGQVQSLNDIDPNSVESISVLKDAASTAIYGSRGSNGIILVTTKKGEEGPLKINYESVYGFQAATVLPKFINTEEYLGYRNILATNEKLRNPGSNLPTYTEQEIQDYITAMKEDPIQYPGASYNMRDIYRTAPQTRQSLTVSGGGNFVQTMLNLAYFYQKGIIWERSYERVNLRMNNNFNLLKSLSGHVNLFYQTAKRKTQASGFPEYEAIQGLHNQTKKYGLGGGLFYDEEGNYLPKGGRKTNPRLEADTRYMGLDQSVPRFYTVDAGLDWQPIKGLKFSGMYAIQNTDNSENYNIPKWDLGFNSSSYNALYYSNQDINRTTFNLLANYQKSFDKHNVSALVEYATEEFKGEIQDLYGQNFFNNEIRNISTGTQENIAISNGLNEWGLRSYFGRLTYDFDDRYFAEVSLRSDGSSRFPKENRYSQFPGASVAWRISEEKFWKKSLTSIVSDFKIRYSYGQTGSHDGVGNYSYIPQLVLNQGYGFTTGPGGEYVVNTIIQNTMASQNLSWEKVTQNDIGVDMGFLQNKLNVTFDVFDKTTNGILLNLPVPGIVGLNPAKTNAGKINNKGWELSTNWRSVIDKFQYRISAGIASVEDRLIDYAGLGITRINGMYYRAEGTPLFAIRGYKTLGIYQTDEEAKNSAHVKSWEGQIGAGDYHYEDVNGDGVIDPDNDYQYLGDRTPKYTFNLNLSANWKGIDLSMLWNGAAKVQTVISGAIGEGGQFNNSPVITYWRDNYWSKEGDTDVHFSKPLWKQSNNSEDNSRYVHNAGYFRLKSLVVGYTLPLSITDRISLNKVRVYFNGTNLLTISKLMRDWGIDPEDAPVQDAWNGLIGGDTNAERHIYPMQLKTFNFGINIQL